MTLLRGILRIIRAILRILVGDTAAPRNKNTPTSEEEGGGGREALKGNKLAKRMDIIDNFLRWWGSDVINKRISKWIN